VRRLSSIIHVSLEDPRLQSQLGDSLRARGIDLLYTSAFCSSVHTLTDLDETIEAFRAAIRGLVSGGVAA
jgi:hypothetical protein